LKISCAELWPSAKPSGYWTVRRIRRFGYVASIGLLITLRRANACLHRARRDAQGVLFTFHRSPPLLTSHFSLLTNHVPLITSHGRASGLAVPAAFGIARELDQVGGSGFEDIGISISQCKSPRSVRDFGENNAGRSRPASALPSLVLSSSCKTRLDNRSLDLLFIAILAIRN
jgi:hypothetical protein